MRLVGTRAGRGVTGAPRPLAASRAGQATACASGAGLQAPDAAARAAAAKAEAARAQAELAFLRAAAQAIAHGKRGEAEALARARGDRDEAGAAVLARLAADRGEFDAAAALAAPASAAAPTGDAALEWGLILFQQGKKAEARRVLAPRRRRLAQREHGGRPAPRGPRRPGAGTDAHRERAVPRSGRGGAAKDAALVAAANTAWGELFLDTHDAANAVTSFRAALEADADWAPAHAGLARALADENPPAAAAAATRALEIDPALVDAHLFLAGDALDADKPAEAQAHLDARARRQSEQPRGARARRGHRLRRRPHGRLRRRRREGARRQSRRTATSSASSPPTPPATTGSTRPWRWPGRRSRSSPTTRGRRRTSGMHLLRVGDERDARRVLETAFRADSYDVVTYNLLQMLDTLDAFESIQAGPVTVRLDPDEAPVLRHYAVPLVNDAMAEMTKRYGFEPQGPILVEIFPKHDDFAVRTLGLPGLLGALGACFGRVVTLDSPRARPPGDFNWQATLWHELAHVFTLQLSK